MDAGSKTSIGGTGVQITRMSLGCGPFGDMWAPVPDQQLGTLVPDLDADLLLLTLMAVTTYPRAYPQVVTVLTGADVSDPALQARFLAFMGALASTLAPAGDKQPGHSKEYS
jgi:hypothetical protein